jgi:dehydrogenase/reductase SDR family member 12
MDRTTTSRVATPAGGWRGGVGRWLDRSVVFSFDQTGFRRHAREFGPERVRDLRDMDCLITGGTRGIGLAAAETLASRGARPVLWSRHVGRGLEASERVQGVFTSVDLGDLDAVSKAAWSLGTRPLGAVVLNAGSMPRERLLSPQGFEVMWASQVLGHVLLLRILRHRGLLTSETRVVWVSSGGMYLQRIDLSDLACEAGYRRHQAYANAKRAQVIASEVLAQRWPEIPSAAMHPGWVDTEAVRHSMPVFRALTLPILRPPHAGADTIVWLASSAEPFETGRFWFDRAVVPLHLRSGTQHEPGDVARLMDGLFDATDPFVEKRT